MVKKEVALVWHFLKKLLAHTTAGYGFQAQLVREVLSIFLYLFIRNNIDLEIRENCYGS
jgi:hypothetical protein